MEATWAMLALDSAQKSLGYSAYARQKAAMFRKRAERAQALITAIGMGIVGTRCEHHSASAAVKFVADALSVKLL
jgi:hypothetical protein